jgi:hypothetical protein
VSRDVFLSYASADKSVADRLCNLLEAAGVTCWIAPRDILPGSDWPSEIHRGISASEVFVLIASEHSFRSRHVQRELQQADSEQRALLPVRVDESTMPDSFGYFLENLQWVTWKEGEWPDVVGAVCTVLHRTPPDSIVSPAMWDRLARGNLTIVSPRWTQEFKAWEQSGMVGYGDTRAMMELSSGMTRLGVSNIATRFHDTLHPDDLNANLVVLGGPDANHVAQRFFVANATTFGWPESASHVVSLFDQRDGTYYSGDLDPDGTSGKDYGVVIRGTNPGHNEHDALLLAGCWGFGTWASARMAFLPQLNAHDLVVAGEPFEALVTTTVQQDTLVDVELLEVRALASSPSAQP